MRVCISSMLRLHIIVSIYQYPISASFLGKTRDGHKRFGRLRTTRTVRYGSLSFVRHYAIPRPRQSMASPKSIHRSNPRTRQIVRAADF